MRSGTISAREHVIRRNIDILRENIIERQLEAEFLENCINETQPKVFELFDKITALGGFPADENKSIEKEKADMLDMYSSANASLETMKNALNEHRAVEVALLKKLEFYKSKRQLLIDKHKENKKKEEAKFVEEGLQFLFEAPEKINVNTDGIKFRKGRNKSKK